MTSFEYIDRVSEELFNAKRWMSRIYRSGRQFIDRSTGRTVDPLDVIDMAACISELQKEFDKLIERIPDENVTTVRYIDIAFTDDMPF